MLCGYTLCGMNVFNLVSSAASATENEVYSLAGDSR